MLDFFYLQGTHQQETLLVAAALPKPTDATHILIQARGQVVRYRLDNVAATAALGFQLGVDDEARLICVHAANFNVCPQVAGAIIDYQWLNKWRAGGG